MPVGGQIDPAYVPVYSHFLGFVDGNGNPTTDTTAQAVFDNGFPNPFGDAQHPNGIFGGNLINLFGLEVPRHFVSPSTQQWNLSVQRELPHNWILEVGYVGTKGTHLRETRDAIQPYDARIHPVTVTALDGTQYTITQNTFSNANARSRAFGLATGNYQLFASDAWSHYDSLQVTLGHRFSRDRSTFRRRTPGRRLWTPLPAATPRSTRPSTTRPICETLMDPRILIAPTDWSSTMTGSLPFLSKSEGVVGALLARWTLSGITTFQSGTPFTVIDAAGGSDFALSSPNTSTATLNPGFTIASAQTHGDIHSRINQFFDPNAISGAPTDRG